MLDRREVEGRKIHSACRALGVVRVQVLRTAEVLASLRNAFEQPAPYRQDCTDTASSLGFTTARGGAVGRVLRLMLPLATRGGAPRSEFCVLREDQDSWMKPTISCFS